MFHRLLVVIASVSLVGCATGPAKLPVENLALSEKTPVVDMRPDTEGKQDIFSLSIFSDRYGYSRVRQDSTDPSGPRLFNHLLQQKYGSGVVPPTKLRHFVVYSNNRAELKRGAMGAALGGAIGAAIAAATETREGNVVHSLVDTARFDAESGEDEFKRAMYAEPQIPEGTSVFVVYIESESQDKRRFTRTVWPIKFTGDKIPLHQAMEAAINYNLNP